MDLTTLSEHYAAIGLSGVKNFISAQEKTKSVRGEMARKIFKGERRNSNRA